jgi:hypothetical protein
MVKGDNMKFKDKKVPFLLLLPLLFPYIILFSLICIFKNTLMEKIFHNNGLYLILLLIITYIIALFSSIIFCVKNILLKINSQKLLYINMIIKLIQIPAYILIFIFSLLCLLTIFTMGISIVLMIFDSMSILLTGIIGLAGIIRCLIENKLPKKTVIIYGILQFVFCVDIIASIIIYNKIKNVNISN